MSSNGLVVGPLVYSKGATAAVAVYALRPSGGVRKNWKRRWCVLDASDQTLVYYKAKPQTQGGPKDALPVEQQVRT